MRFVDYIFWSTDKRCWFEVKDSTIDGQTSSQLLVE